MVIDLGVNRKRTCDFLLVISSNIGRISYRFSDIDVLNQENWKIACFATSSIIWRSARREPVWISE